MMKPHLKHSLTIKQMAAVAGVTLVTIAIFISIQLIYLIDQRREDYQNQLFNAGVSIQQPLADALLRSDLNDAKKQIIGLKATGILGKAIVMQPEKILHPKRKFLISQVGFLAFLLKPLCHCNH